MFSRLLYYEIVLLYIGNYFYLLLFRLQTINLLGSLQVYYFVLKSVCDPVVGQYCIMIMTEEKLNSRLLMTGVNKTVNRIVARKQLQQRETSFN